MKEFYTISKNETTEIIEKKSKFIADIYPVKNVEEAENKIKEIIKEYIENLNIGLSNIINLLEPQCITLGGGFVHFKDILWNDLELEFKKAKYLFNKEDIPVIKLAELGNDAGIIGASIDINKK